jgi:hypothetical protein
MRKFIALFIFALSFSAMTYAQVAPKPVAKPTLSAKPAATTPAATEGADPFNGRFDFKFDKYDYGTIQKGANPYVDFPFTNNGTEPLVIESAKGSCGCTIPEYPKQPILPGETSAIKVKYDTNRLGGFAKDVTIKVTGVETPKKISIMGKVEEAPAGLPTKEKPSLMGN